MRWIPQLLDCVLQFSLLLVFGDHDVGDGEESRRLQNSMHLGEDRPWFGEVMSFAEWRRRAAVLQAIHRIAAGDAITTIALDLGYGSPAAFTSMFKRTMRAPPSHLATISHRGDGHEE
jgi:AraC-like DNA-binding protein